jgi:hypothetical protein
VAPVGLPLFPLRAGGPRGATPTMCPPQNFLLPLLEAVSIDERHWSSGKKGI